MTEERFKAAGVDRRRAPRFNISLPVRFFVPATSRTYHATVDNISLGGVLIITDAALSEGTRVELHLPITDDATMRIEAVLARASNVGEFGLAFLSLSDEELDRLADFVDQRIET